MNGNHTEPTCIHLRKLVDPEGPAIIRATKRHVAAFRSKRLLLLLLLVPLSQRRLLVAAAATLR